MRLINVRTLLLEEFYDETTVEYAILSHRWGDDEVSYQDMQNEDVRASKAGFAKIQTGCIQAAHDGYEYFWCDTCCINKESTAELSEAINSMFRWYKHSKVCYVFMSDVDSAISDVVRPAETSYFHDNSARPPAQHTRKWAFEASQWFRRGWTLQELIAPKRVEFFDRNWAYIGSRHFLIQSIFEVTGIAEHVLSGEPDKNLYSCSVAQRMSWASNRVTTRAEDMAYCLLGLFDVNMPMLYGEGDKAFIRLQEEILKQSDDHTIFAWNMTEQAKIAPRAPLFSGLLADAPSAFSSCKHVKEIRARKRSSFTMTNRGLSITLYARPFTTHTCLALLNCSTQAGMGSGNPLAILLQRQDEDDQYLRVPYKGQSFIEVPIKLQTWDFEDKLARLNFKQVSFHVRQRLSTVLRVPVADAFRVSLRTKKEDLRSRLVTFDTLTFTPSVQVGFTTASFPVTRLQLSLDHDLNVICFMELCSEITIESNERDFQYRPLKHHSLFAPFSMTALDEPPSWTVLAEGKGFQADVGLWVIKGDREGFDVSASPFGQLRLFTTPWWDERTRITWHLDILLADSVSTDGVSFWAR